MLHIRFGHKKTSLKIGQNELTCYVLENDMRVVTMNSINKALGYDGKSENWTIELINKLNTFIPVDSNLLSAFNDVLLTAIRENKNEKKTHESTVESRHFINLCRLLIKAKEEGYLNASQLKHAKLALQIINTLGKSTIEDLIDEVTGFTRYKIATLDHLVTLLKKQDSNLVVGWINTFPIPFIEYILEMNNMTWDDVIKNPLSFGKLLDETIYSRIDEATWNDIQKTKPKRAYTRKNNKKQDIEHPKLKEHILILNSLITVSGNNWNIFIQLLNKTFPKQKGSFKIIYIEDKKENLQYSGFNEMLKTVLFK